MSCNKPCTRRRDRRVRVSSRSRTGTQRYRHPPSPNARFLPDARAGHTKPRFLFWRYGLIGAGATALHYALLIVLVESAHMRPGPASAFAAGIGALVAYRLNRHHTFGAVAPHRRALVRFLITATLGAAANGVIVSQASAVLGMHYLVAQALASGAVLFLTFQLNARWTFAPI